MKLEVLLSCMNQTDISIVSESNLKCDVLVINQTKHNNYFENNNVRLICTDEKGLSKSRNKAISNARGDICLLSDDDEFFYDGFENIILEKYKALNADIIIFNISNYHKKIKEKEHRMKRLELLKVSSVQISFRLKSIKNVLMFDEKLGAGTTNGFGEETKFLLDAYKKKLRIYYVPIDIGELKTSVSSWFKGYDYYYFYRRGKIIRYLLGMFLGSLYSFYFLLFKHSKYKSTTSFFKAFSATIKGLFTKDIEKDLLDKPISKNM